MKLLGYEVKVGRRVQFENLHTSKRHIGDVTRFSHGGKEFFVQYDGLKGIQHTLVFDETGYSALGGFRITNVL